MISILDLLRTPEVAELKKEYLRDLETAHLEKVNWRPGLESLIPDYYVRSGKDVSLYSAYWRGVKESRVCGFLNRKTSGRILKSYSGINVPDQEDQDQDQDQDPFLIWHNRLEEYLRSDPEITTAAKESGIRIEAEISRYHNSGRANIAKGRAEKKFRQRGLVLFPTG